MITKCKIAILRQHLGNAVEGGQNHNSCRIIFLDAPVPVANSYNIARLFNCK